MKELRIVIAGSRDFNNYDLLKQEVFNIIKYEVRPKDFIKIISGGARGADTLGEQFAEEFGLEIKRFIPDWNNLGKKAGYIRNAEMAKYAMQDDNYGMLIAFWNGTSKGTKHMIDLANKYGLFTKIINY